MNKNRITQRTLRLTLRPFKKGDEEHMFKWTSDEEVARYMTWNAHANIAETKNFVNSTIEEYKKNPYHWMIVWNETGIPIGSLGSTEQDRVNKTCEVGYCLRRDFWHRGIMTEALTAALSFLMYEEGFDTVTASHNVLNPNSGKVMQKCGMKFSYSKEMFVPAKNKTITADCYEIKKL